MLTPNLTLRDLQNAATPRTLAHGRELARRIEGLDWDEYSLWGCLPSEGIGVGELLVHHLHSPADRDPAVQSLRELHAAIDHAVLDA